MFRTILILLWLPLLAFLLLLAFFAERVKTLPHAWILSYYFLITFGLTVVYGLLRLYRSGIELWAGGPRKPTTKPH